jgi:hypothetical protein
MKADFLGMMIMSSRGVENLPGEELTESSEGGNHDSPDSTPDSPRNISSTSVMSGKIPGTSVMSGKIPSTSVTPEATLGTGGTGMMEVTTLLGCSGENKGDSLRPGNTPMGSPGTLGTEMLPLFHLHTNLNFMRKSLRHQEKLITEAIAKHSSGLALHSGWESLEYMYGPKARMLGLTGAFNKAMQGFCFDLVRKVRGEIMDKYLEDSQSPQNDITPGNQQQATSSIFGISGRRPTETLPHFRLLSIPGNDVPPPLPASSPVFMLTDGHLQAIFNTLPFLWEGFLTGEEWLHPTMLTSPFGMRFNKHIINGQRVKHAVVYDAALVFFHDYPNSPSIRNGDAYITFVHRNHTDIHLEAPSNPPPDVPPPPPPPAQAADELPPTVPTTPDLSYMSSPSYSPLLSPRPLERTSLGAVIPAGMTPDAFSHGSAQPSPEGPLAPRYECLDSRTTTGVLTTSPSSALGFPVAPQVDAPVVDKSDTSHNDDAMHASTTATVLTAVMGPLSPIDLALSGRVPRLVRRPHGRTVKPAGPFDMSGTVPTQSAPLERRHDILSNEGPDEALGGVKDEQRDPTDAQGTSKHPQDPVEALVPHSPGADGRDDESVGGGHLGWWGKEADGERDSTDAQGTSECPQDPFGSLVTQSSGADGQDDESVDKGPVGWRRRLARGTEGRGGQTNAQGTSKRPQDLSEALVTQSQGAEGRMNGSPGGGCLGQRGEGTNGRRNPPDAQGTSESPQDPSGRVVTHSPGAHGRVDDSQGGRHRGLLTTETTHLGRVPNAQGASGRPSGSFGDPRTAAHAFGMAATQPPRQGRRIDETIKGSLTETTEGQKDSPKVRGPSRTLPRQANDILTQSPVADARIDDFADEGWGGWTVNKMSKQEDIPKVQGSLGDDPMPTEDLVTQPLVVNGWIHGSAGGEDSPMVCRPFRYTLEQVNDLVMQSPWVASQDYKSTDMATPKLPGDGDLGREALLKEELTPPPWIV